MDRSKKRKIFLIIIFVVAGLLLAYFGIFAMTLLSQGEGYLVVEPVTLPPVNSKLMEKIEEFSSVMDAIESGKRHFSMEIPIEDYKELLNVMDNGSYIKIDETYYHITISAFAGVERLAEPSNKTSVNLTSTELKEFRPLNLSLYYWRIEKDESEENVFFAKASFSEVLAIEKLIEEKGDILKYGGDYFRIFLKARLGFEEFLKPENCIILDKRVDNFPLFKKGLYEAEKESKRLKAGEVYEFRRIDNIGSVEGGGGGVVRIRMAVSEIDDIIDTFGYFECVRYNDGLFRVALIKPMG